MKNLENTNCSRREGNRLLDCKHKKFQLNFKSQKKSLTHYNVVKGAELMDFRVVECPIDI